MKQNHNIKNLLTPQIWTNKHTKEDGNRQQKETNDVAFISSQEESETKYTGV